MPLTAFKEYKWLIDTLENHEEGYTQPDLINLFNKEQDDIQIKNIRAGRPNDEGCFRVKRLRRNTLKEWRCQVYCLYGLLIRNTGANYAYVLENRDKLNEVSSIRKMVDLLASIEDREETKTIVHSRRGRRVVTKNDPPVIGSIVDFVSTGFGGETFGYVNTDIDFGEPTMLDLVQFSMAVGEGMIIKYGKHKVGESHKDKAYVLEPQQLKYINGRWYVGGNLYEYGKKEESFRTTIYDIEQIRLVEDIDENLFVDPHYILSETFDIEELVPADWFDYFDPNQVVSVNIRAPFNLFDKTPLTPVQTEIKELEKSMYKTYKVFANPTRDFILQLLSYGEEIVILGNREEIPSLPTDLTETQISYLKGLRREMLK